MRKQTAPCDYDQDKQSCYRCLAFNRPCTFTRRINGPGGIGPGGRPLLTIDLISSGGKLEMLGMPTHFHRASKMAGEERPMVRDIDPPFAADIDFDVTGEEGDAVAKVTEEGLLPDMNNSDQDD